MKTIDRNSLPLRIQRGIQVVPLRGCFYGPSGVGKSTLASQCPNPLIIDFEGGTHHLDVDRVEPKDWDEAIAIVNALRDEPHHYGTVVIDTADWAEQMMTVDICKKHNKASIEEFAYGKGTVLQKDSCQKFLGLLDGLRAKGIHVVFVAHSQIRKFEQPDQSGAYDRYELKLSKQASPLLKEWCDMVLFCSYETKVIELDGRKKAVGGRDRVLYTCHTAAWDAKNRHGFPEKLPFQFSSIASAFGPVPKKAAPATVAKAARSTAPACAQQLENIQNLWKQLGYGQTEMSKLFQWLDAEALSGAENWSDLTEEQAARAIGFLSKKITEAAQ
jgi:hypothetical protein